MRSAYTSNNKTIPVDVFTPASGKHPIVMALHGSGGMHNVGHLEFAQLLANQGFCVFVPHYFASTGTLWADEATIWREFPVWMGTISEGIDFAQKHPLADSSRIGVIGFSLGAYLGLALASQQPRISAVVDFFGGMPPYFADNLQRMPPTLILHGEADTIVRVDEAHKIARLYDQHQLPYEMKVYRNAGHGFRGFDMMDAGQRTYSFLKKQLG